MVWGMKNFWGIIWGMKNFRRILWGMKKIYKDSKKIENKKMRIFFNYHLKYPTFKEGLEMIKNQIT